MITSVTRHTSVFMKIMAQPKNITKPQKFKYFLVLDFEANCQQGSRLDPQEIIEFPCLLVDSKSFQILQTFHEYIKPVGIPKITPFCTELTGITQDMVDTRQTFPGVLEKFQQWYTGNDLTPVNSTFVTCGLWDLVDMLPKQCNYSGVGVPDFLDVGASGEFVNVKFSFQKQVGKYGKGLKEMQSQLGLKFEGRHHSGIDDCRNIVGIMESLARMGFVFENNGLQKPKYI